MTNQTSDSVDRVHTTITRLGWIVYGAGVVAAGVWAQFGAPIWILFALASAACVLAVRQRREAAVAMGSVLLAMTWVLLVALMATAGFHLPMLLTASIVVVAIGIAGVASMLRGGAIRWPSRVGILSLVPALAGPLVWIALVATTAFGPSAARFSWVMSGDSPNNLLFARTLTSHSGILVGARENPVPLPTGLLALFMAPGRGSVSAATLLVHDLLSFAQLWALTIALLCLLAGVVAARMAQAAKAPIAVVAIIAAAGSLLPISWLVLVYPAEYGFFGSHVALVVIFSCLLVYSGARRSPRASFGILALACTLLLSIWSPLVVITAALGLVVVIQDWRVFRRTRGRELVVLLLCAVQLFVYGIAVVLPGFLQQEQFLTAVAGPNLFPPPLVFILIGIAVVGVVATKRRGGWQPVIGVIALAAGSLLGLAVLLIESGRGGNYWTYYPSKFAWTIIVVFAVVLVGALPPVLTTYFSRTFGRNVAAVLAVLIAGIAVLTVPNDPEHPAALPINWILDTTGDAAAETIVTSADLDHPIVFWQSDLPNEQFVNFWLLEVASRSVSNDRLRTYAYSYREDGVTDLCSILRLMGTGVTVNTASPTLAARVAHACPSTEATVIRQS